MLSARSFLTALLRRYPRAPASRVRNICASPAYVAFQNDHSCVSVNLDVLRGREPDVSHSYHNRFAHLQRVAMYASIIVQTRANGVPQGPHLLLLCTAVGASLVLNAPGPLSTIA